MRQRTGGRLSGNNCRDKGLGEGEKGRNREWGNGGIKNFRSERRSDRAMERSEQPTIEQTN